MVSFFAPSRCVLLVGDEALYVYNVTGRATKLVDSVPWQTEDFEETVTSLITKECGRKPVMILNDMTDQHFKGGQRIPNVGALDKGNVIKRKVQAAFPNYPIRGALPVPAPRDPVKDSMEGARKGLAAKMFLFAAVPMSEPIAKTVHAVRRSMAPIVGFFLLPVEASDMVRALAEKISGKGKKASRWTIFIGQHQNGDLRQVIVRDGYLAMTRMTSVIESDSDPNVWAQEVYNEFKATISYLSRFGYSPQEGTDMIVIAGQQAGEALEGLVDIECNYRAFTSPEAARVLGINIGIQEDPRHADALHAAWAGRKTKFVLPMEAAELTSIHRPRQMASMTALILIFACGYLGWQAAGQMQGLLRAQSDLDDQRRLLAQAETRYQQEVDRLAVLGFDVKLIRGSIGAYKNFEKERIGLLPVIEKIGEALGNDLRLDALDVNREDELKRTVDGQEIKHAQFDIRMSLTFPSTIDPAAGIREVNNLERRLKTLLPNYTVRVERQVASPEYTAAISETIGVKDQGAAEDYPAELSIKGPIQ